MRRALTAAAVFPAIAAAVSPALGAADSDWLEVARVRDGSCQLSITGQGRFYRIAASGLKPGTAARFTLTNGDMKPLDWIVRADAGGGFARYYLPFRWHRAGDTVAVRLDGADCAVSASFAWRRATGEGA